VDGVEDVAVRDTGGGDAQLVIDCLTDARDGVECEIARVVAGRWSLHRLQREQPTLENIFLRYIGEQQS
jgi:hypothetical protein